MLVVALLGTLPTDSQVPKDAGSIATPETEEPSRHNNGMHAKPDLRMFLNGESLVPAR